VITNPENDWPIALTFDLEYWWSSELLKRVNLTEKKPILEEASELILGLLAEHGTRATFFVLGSVAEKNPQLIRRIHQEGHEIAAHGYSHKNVFDFHPENFKDEVQKVTEILSTITSERPLGFRAPNFSFDERTVWAYDVLREFGYKYSSSVFPFKTKLYGVPKAPLKPYSPSSESILLHDPQGEFIEFPATVFQILGKNIPISGGFYFRLLPVWLIKFCLTKVIKKRPAVFYLHMRDLYEDVPRLRNLPLRAQIFHYLGIKRSLPKFESLLTRFEFRPVREVLDLN
jgi:polysaccharide deacetylase family protein (PEP-CTERM system associated)